MTYQAKSNIYETITSQIVAAIEAGAETYRMPWHASGEDITNPRNLATGKPYRGINTLMLWAIAERHGYGSGIWATYRQWQERGAQVRKGEKAASVVFWKPLESENAQTETASETEQSSRFVARGYAVFNQAQVEGYEPPAPPLLSEAERIGNAEAFFEAIPATVTPGGESCCYDPATDAVRMVPFERFRTAASYYSTLAHELTHWTGGRDRLDRDLSGRFGSEAYAMEELIALSGQSAPHGTLQ